jgi:hypothetical protein
MVFEGAVRTGVLVPVGGTEFRRDSRKDLRGNQNEVPTYKIKKAWRIQECILQAFNQWLLKY